MTTTGTPSISTSRTTSTRTPTTADVVRAVQHVQDGRLTRARSVLGELWAGLADGPTWLRSAVAHWLAVAAPDAPTELAWRDRAVDEAMCCVDRSMPFAGTGWTVGDMLPRLLLASAQAYALADQPCAAMEDLAQARELVSSLPAGPARVQLRSQLASVERTVNGGLVAPLRAMGGGSAGWRRLAPEDEEFDDTWFDDGWLSSD